MINVYDEGNGSGDYSDGAGGGGGEYYDGSCKCAFTTNITQDHTGNRRLSRGQHCSRLVR